MRRWKIGLQSVKFRCEFIITINYQKRSVSLDYPNILNQQFNPNEPNRPWVSDITYIPVENKFVSLCVIMDLFSRKVIAWKLSHYMTASLVIANLDNALTQRQPNESVLFHSDRGSQYTPIDFRQFLDVHKLVASYSKPGYPYDNVVIESFFKYLKRDEINRRNFNFL